MSHEIVKSITIKDNKVFINSASNNCRPLSYSNEEYPYFTKILNEKGEQELHIALLKSFEEGDLQSSLNNKYTRALKVLHYVFKEEYNKFDWRLNNYKYDSEEYKAYNQRRESQEFKDLLLRALNTQLPKEKFIIYNTNKNCYVRKETSRNIFYCYELAEAKKYNFKEQAERTAKHIQGEIKQI